MDTVSSKKLSYPWPHIQQQLSIAPKANSISNVTCHVETHQPYNYGLMMIQKNDMENTYATTHIHTVTFIWKITQEIKKNDTDRMQLRSSTNLMLKWQKIKK